MGRNNILPKLRTSVSGRELDVELDKGGFVRPKTPIKIEVWVPTLSSVDVSGAADIEVEGLHGERFQLDLSGASDSILRGEIDRLEVDISGAGELEAKELHAKTVELELSGAGEVVVWASESLDVDISGAGEVTYYGNPGNISQDISGAGKLKSGG